MSVLDDSILVNVATAMPWRCSNGSRDLISIS